MKANPGGHIPPSEVIGRDALIDRLWRVLERQSLVLLAERRIGKTCIIKKMCSEASGDTLAIFSDLERVHTSLEFVQTVFHDVEDYLSRLGRTAGRVREVLATLSGAELGGVLKFPEAARPHWKTLLTKTIEDLVEHQERDVVLFWDEVPIMIYNIKERDGEKTAMEVLDTLRSLRQMNDGLRMVFTGSIGLHNVINSLKRAGYTNAPINDMCPVDVPPLSHEDAEDLAWRLLEGEGIPTDDPRGTACAIANAVDGIPFYVHHVVDQMKVRDSKADAKAAQDIVTDFLTDPLDPWNLRHYRERINVYYIPDEQPFALGLLDVLAGSDKPLPFDELFNLLKHHMETEDKETARDVLTLLQSDHYIVQEPDGKFRFRFRLIQRWWRLARGVAK